MAQKVEGKDERALQHFSLKDFLAVNTTSSRLAIPKNAFYDLENAQPIGNSNIHSIADITASLHNYGADIIYTDDNANIGGTEYLIQASGNGKLFAFNVAASTVAQINGGITLAGSGTTFAQWSNTTVLLVDSTGYYEWTGAGNISAVVGTGLPTSGSAIAVYQNRVWIVQGRTLFFSVAGSFTDFTVANGGGSVTLVDPVLRSSVQALLAANGYLYIFGTTSINAISDLYVPTGASPPTPIFTNLNLSAIVGTDQPYSIQMYGRLVLFANRYGVWSLYGTTVNQISGPDPNNAYQSDIDGTWQYVSFASPISGGQLVSNGLLCASFLISRPSDPIFGTSAPVVIAMYQGNAAGGRWWFANYGATGTVTRVSTAFLNNEPALFAYIGNQIYQVFANAASSPPAVISTALWDFDDPITEKQVIKVAVGIQTYALGASPVLSSISIDTPNLSLPVTFVPPFGYVSWVNNAGNIVTWKNNSNAVVQWWNPKGYFTYWGQAQQAFSKFVGVTIKTPQGMVFELDAIMLDYKWGARYVGN